MLGRRLCLSLRKSPHNQKITYKVLICQAGCNSMLSTLATDLEKVEPLNYFIKIQGASSRTTEPILGLFVLI